jgi:hypothetical protein
VDHEGNLRKQLIPEKHVLKFKLLGAVLAVLLVRLLIGYRLAAFRTTLAVNNESCGNFWGRSVIVANNFTYINANYKNIGHTKLAITVDGCKGTIPRFESVTLHSMNRKAQELRGIVAACVQQVLAKDKCK